MSRSAAQVAGFRWRRPDGTEIVIDPAEIQVMYRWQEVWPEPWADPRKERDAAILSILLDREFTLFGKRATVDFTLAWPDGLPAGCVSTDDVLDLLARNAGRERRLS
jgi:hypothetical protein